MSIQISNLKDSPNKVSETLNLIEDSLNYSSENSFEQDFYPLFNIDNHGNCYIVLKNDEVIAHIGFCPREVIINNHLIPIGMIGGICVKKEYQGQKIFSELFSRVIHSHEEDCAFFMLWSDKNDIYEKFGFFEFGQNYIHTLMGTNKFEQTYFQNLTQIEKNQIEVLYNGFHQNTIFINREEFDWDIIANIKSELHIYKEDNLIKAYYFKSKGQDLSGIVHELTFADTKYLNYINEQEVWHPRPLDDQPLAITYSGMMRANTNQHFVDFINMISDNSIEIQEFSQTEINFIFKENEFTLGLNQFINGVFGPDFISEFKDFHSVLFISGLDSI